MSDRDEYVKRVKAELAAMGYVVLKEASYRKAQERQRIAQVRMESAIEDRQHQRDWLDRDVFPWQRHLTNRVDHLAGLARALGATAGDFVGPGCGCGSNGCMRPS